MYAAPVLSNGFRPAAAPPRTRILLVDDSVTSQMWVRMILKRGPFELVCASDGVEGVQRALDELPDLVLMDMVMPRMDGLEAVRRLRAAQATREIPVIMLTTRSEAHHVEMAYQLGCSDYVTKPIDGEELLVKISSYAFARVAA